jgi:ABC-type sulfate transport system permease subunit
MKRSSANEITARAYESPRIPVGLLVLVLLPLLMLPLAAMVIFAFKRGPGAFLAALKAPDADCNRSASSRCSRRSASCSPIFS